MAGPIANVAENVEVGYFYPPPLSQLFAPLVGVDQFDLAVVSACLQVVVLGAVLPHLVPAGRRTPAVLLWVAAATIWSYPMQFALYGGNVSALLAIGVTICLVGPSSGKAVVAATAAAIKLTPAPLLLVAVMARATRTVSVAAVAAIVLISALLSPRAWSDWIAVVPNVLRNEMNRGAANYSPAAIGEALGFADVGVAVGLVLCGVFLVRAIRTSRTHPPMSLPVLTSAIAATTLASSTLWDHYLAVLVPLYVWAWFRAESENVRLLAVVAAMAGLGQWAGMNELLWYRTGVVGLAVLSFWALGSPAGGARRATL